MIVLKVKSAVLSAALQDRTMSALRVYMSSYKRTKDDCFICEEVDSDKGLVPEIKLSLFDYTFNERESDRIWKLAKDLLGKEIIDLQIVKKIEL